MVQQMRSCTSMTNFLSSGEVVFLSLFASDMSDVSMKVSSNVPSCTKWLSFVADVAAILDSSKKREEY